MSVSESVTHQLLPDSVERMNHTVNTWTELPADPALSRRAHEILDEASHADGVDAFSEQFVLGIDDKRLEHRHLVALSDGKLAGFAAIAGDDVELVVAPAYRRAGLGTRLIQEVKAQNGAVGVWAHGNLPAAATLAAAQGLERKRRLLVMAIDGEKLSSARAEVPEGYTVRDLADSTERYGREVAESAWLEVNNDAFSWHPEQGGWDLSRLHRAQEASWYTDEDVLLLWHEATESPTLAGFHWTKWQPGVDGSKDRRHGEVYVVGLASDFRGRGLGSPVVEIGLAHLYEGGAQEVILYVEDDNAAAVRRYERIGFHVTEEHVVYG